jgi:hypothetical protein
MFKGFMGFLLGFNAGGEADSECHGLQSPLSGNGVDFWKAKC